MTLLIVRKIDDLEKEYDIDEQDKYKIEQHLKIQALWDIVRSIEYHPKHKS